MLLFRFFQQKTGIISDPSGTGFFGDQIAAAALPDTLTDIGDSAFNTCVRLEELILPDSVAVIGSNAFYGCRTIPELDLPGSLTAIGSRAFYDCTGLTRITFHASAPTIGEMAFSSVKAEVIYPANDTTWVYIANRGYAEAVNWAVEKGITNGMDATHFGPDGKCTRAQIVTFLYRYMN